MHNARLVDPLDPIVKQIREVTSKKIKTDDDHAEIAELEFLGGIYFEPDVGPYVPAGNLQKCITEGARLTRDGKKIERGVFIETPTIPVVYDGPTDLDKLFADKRFVHRVPVRNGTNRVMRTRPVFRRWALQATGMYDGSVINLQELRNAATSAGLMIGLGDGRPTFGRFTCTLEAGDQ
jgi:hypothetical protein